MKKKPKLTRQENWPTLLGNYLDEKRQSQFDYGRMDCCLFVADWVALVTGFDPAKPWRNKYGSIKTAFKFLKEFGGVKNLANGLFPSCALHEACDGDLVAWRTTNKEPAVFSTALGILDSRYGIFMAKEGTTYIPRAALQRRAWRVGRCKQ
tara:strand:+ start:112 stop:564 length:453 start_codon:yes stop_codon:yes gene_type:complete